MKTIMKMDDENDENFVPAKAVFWVLQHLAMCQCKTAKTNERNNQKKDERILQ